MLKQKDSSPYLISNIIEERLNLKNLKYLDKKKGIKILWWDDDRFWNPQLNSPSKITSKVGIDMYYVSFPFITFDSYLSERKFAILHAIAYL